MSARDKDERGQANKRGYFGAIAESAKSVMEGMAVTFAELLRAPNNHTTIQYPDRTPLPVVDSLPERYRGFLEVDLDTCTGCKACERDCPINVIAIDLEKVGGERMLTRFDIDMGKCMYCGICVESCPVEVQSPGDAEPTKCIRMTREFEAASDDFHTLTFRFIEGGEHVPPFKPKKGEIPPSPRRGEIARAVRAAAREHNPEACDWALAQIAPPVAPDDAALVEEQAVLARANHLLALVRSAEGEKGIEDILFNEALAQTDSGRCGYSDCRAYARALATGKETNPDKCGPGGLQSARDARLVLSLRAGRSAPESAKEVVAALAPKRDEDAK